MTEEFKVTLKTKLDEKGIENLQMKLRAYNLGKEFNYAIAVLRLNIANGESDTRKPLIINLIPKVQYITPFVSEKLAKEYHDELLKIDKLVMFLTVGEDGRVVLEENIVDNVIKNDSKLDSDKIKNIEKEKLIIKLQEIIKMLQKEQQLHIDTMKKIEQELINQEENIKYTNWDISTNNITANSITIKNKNGKILLRIDQDGIATPNKVKELNEENETDKFINFLLDLEKRITKLENNKLDNDMKNISNKVGENIINGLKRMDKNFS